MTSTPHEPDDVALLLAVARRDEEAFAALYDRMERPIFSLIVRILRERAEAEEVLQEAFWQIWQHAESYRPELGTLDDTPLLTDFLQACQAAKTPN